MKMARLEHLKYKSAGRHREKEQKFLSPELERNGSMRLRSFTLLVLASALLLFAVKGAAAFPSQEIFYTVRYSCIVGPGNWIGHVEGEWVTHCDGTTTGWGWEPGHNCTTTDITWGNTCSVGGGGGGGGEDSDQN